MNFRSALATLGAVLLMAGCASHSIVLTTGSQQAREAADQEQRTADLYRTHGAPDAARQAQARADAQRAQADKPADSFMSWLIDTLFYSWLESSAASSGVKTNR